MPGRVERRGDRVQLRHPAGQLVVESQVAERHPGLLAEPGEHAVWGDGQCSTWPATAADPYRGPWDRGTTPVLVIGPTNDPSTPFENSKKMVDELGAGARLLTVEGYGHTAFLKPSA
jgi:pimeloyl-ACP methyl ester carboxylesterase